VYAHAGCEGHFSGLARRAKTVVKGLDDGVIPAGRQSRHIEGSSDPGPSSPDHPLAQETAAVSIEGGYPYQRGNLVAVQGAQLGEFGQEGDGHHWANPRDTAQQVVFLSPQGTLPNGGVEIPVQATQLLLQPADMVLDPLAHRIRSSDPQPVLLGSKHLDNLVTPGQEGRQFLGLGIRQGMGSGPDRLGEVGQDLGIQSVGLSQPASGSSKVSDLAGIDHGQGQPCCRQGTSHRHLEAARGLQHHQFWVELSQSLDYLSDSRSIISRGPDHSGGTYCYIQPVLGNVDPYVRTLRLQWLSPFWPFLARYGLVRPRQLFGLSMEMGWRPKLFIGLTRPRESRSASPLLPSNIHLLKHTRGEDIAYGWKGKGSTVHLVTEGNGLPLAFLVTAANVAEVTMGLKVIDQVKVPRHQGRPRQRPATLATDKSYDSANFRQELRRRGIQPSIPQRKWKNRRRRPGRPSLVHQVSQSRWKVERSHGWLDNWRRLVTRYDWYTQSYVAFLTIACFMAALSRILD
jgi:transposase